MPYIKQTDREVLDKGGAVLLAALAETGWQPGNLNYTITKLCLGYMPDGRRYSDYNEVIGVLECIKLELYRRAVGPYENKKCMEAGDVY